MLIIIDRFQVITSVGVDGETVIQSEEKRRRSKLIRNRWWKMVTLAKNPSLVLKVLEENLKNERNNVEQVSLKNNFCVYTLHKYCMQVCVHLAYVIYICMYYFFNLFSVFMCVSMCAFMYMCVLRYMHIYIYIYIDVCMSVCA